VDDGSRDRSMEVLSNETSNDPNVKVLSFSRNFGHQVAISAGIEFASGDAVIVMDADLQDPPEIIPELVEKWRQGLDVVYATRRRRDGETILKKLTARIFYRLIKTLTRFDIPVDTGDFRLMSRAVVDVFLAMPERQRYIRGMISWIGFKQGAVYYERARRARGETKFTYAKMMRFAVDGITSFSYVPLQMASYLGFFSALVSLLLIVGTIYVKLYNNQAIPGWASIVIVMLFLGGIQLMMIGLLGEYLGRMYEEKKQRPLYIVQKAINFSQSSAKKN
jgi:dolichol-phosphate mannosyltransferase